MSGSHLWISCRGRKERWLFGLGSPDSLLPPAAEIPSSGRSQGKCFSVGHLMYLLNWQKTSFSRQPQHRRRWPGICHKGFGGPENDTQPLETDNNTQSHRNAGTLGSNCRPSRSVFPRKPPKRSKKACGGLESDRPGSARPSNDGGGGDKAKEPEGGHVQGCPLWSLQEGKIRRAGPQTPGDHAPT